MMIEITTPEEVGLSSQRLERIKPAMQVYVDQKKIAGISTMVARKGKIVHFEQVGWMDKEAKKPMSDDAIFRIYSMTKPIICTALMILYEQGRFQLFHPIAKYIPAFGDVKVLESDAAGGTREVDLLRPITIRDLLTHTAGLTYDFMVDSPVGEMYQQARLLNDAERSLEEMISELTRMPLAFQPGTRWHYSLAIDVLAHLIEILSDQPLNQFLKEQFFHPLGMVDTDFFVPPNKEDRIATMYGRPDLMAPNMTLIKEMELWENGYNEQIDVSNTNPTSFPGSARGGHGLFSTTQDYMRFALMLLNNGKVGENRILSRKIIDLMHTNHLPVSMLPYEVVSGFPEMGYGFGLGSRVLLNVAESQLPGSVGEFGWSGAAKTYYWVDPQEEIVGVFMTQDMIEFELPEKDLQLLTYQALVD